MEKLIITPKTKIYDLLEAYPELEESLIEAAPPFKKLKNPILRKTIARVTTLSQAASVAGISVESLINKLREEIGQTGAASFDADTPNYITEQPQWFSQDKIAQHIDITEMLNAGEQPVHEVLSVIKSLTDNTILATKAPFIPAPLLDKAKSLGYKYWLVENGPEDFTVYFTK